MQGELFDTNAILSKPLLRPAHTRNAIGDIAARFAGAALGCRLLPIVANAEICPDFALGNLRGEIKSIGKNRRGLLYKWRAEKEARNFDPKSMSPNEIKAQMEAAHAQLEAIYTRSRKATPAEIGNVLGRIVELIATHGASADLRAVLQVTQARSLMTLRHVRHAAALQQ